MGRSLMEAALVPETSRVAFILIAGGLATIVWRFAGVLLAGRISEESEIFRWVRAVATALIAAIVARLVLFPTGALAETPLLLRLGAVAVGFAVVLCGRRWTFAAIFAGLATLVFGWSLFGIYA